MTTFTTIRKALVVTAAVALLAACGGGSDGDKSQTGRLKLSMTDAPVDDVQEVWVKFSAVEFKPEGDAPVLNPLSPAQSLNLLEFQDGRAAVLVNDAVLPAGRYEWIRLVVDNVPNVRDSYVMANGAECELTVPSGAESGLKMNRGFTLPADGSVALTVDFDLRKSLHAPCCGRRCASCRTPKWEPSPVPSIRCASRTWQAASRWSTCSRTGQTPPVPRRQTIKTAFHRTRS